MKVDAGRLIPYHEADAAPFPCGRPGELPMAIRTPRLSVDDQEYYPLHEEDDVPETPPHRREVTDLDGALHAHFPDWFVSGNVCIYWEQGNTQDYRAPDLFVVKEPLSEPVTRVYQLWKQPSIAFALEVGSRTTFRTDVGPKVELYEQRVKAREYCHIDLDHGVKRLWRLGPGGYEEIEPEANGRLRSAELGLELDLEEDRLQIYTPAGERLLKYEEERRRRLEAEQEREEEARRRQEAEQAREAEARLRQEAEARAAELARQLAALQARLADRGEGSA
jgi:Uma2 family endonuclease